MVKTSDLLKLSDYPFSYSLIGGLFLILAGKSMTFSEIFTAEFGPILAIMGIVGTGLAISDPFGRLLKKIGIYSAKKDLPRTARTEMRSPRDIVRDILDDAERRLSS